MSPDITQSVDFLQLSRQLQHLQNRYGVVGLKAGTEIEDMEFDEIECLHLLGMAHNIPTIVKVGGPEARNDIRQLLRIGVAGILGPMIESMYALNIFHNALKQLAAPEQFEHLIRAINLETAQAASHFDGMLVTEAGQQLTHITVGRGDLSASMNLDIDDEDVMTLTRSIVAKARKQKKITSVGGGITPDNAVAIGEMIQPDRINTRHVVISAINNRNLGFAVKAALEFEMQLYDFFASLVPHKALAYRKRIKVTQARLQKMPRLNTQPQSGQH